MKTLREIPCGKNAKVVKLTGEGLDEKTDHGYGNHKRRRYFCEKSSSAWRSSRSYRTWL